MKRDSRSLEKIVEAATSLFHRWGYHATSLDDILEASDVCRSNFYYHFRSKEDLGMEVLRQQAEAFETWCIRGILEDRSIPALRRLERLYEAIADRQRSEEYRCGCPFGNLAAELGGIHPEFQRLLSEFFARWEDAIHQCLQDGLARGEFPPVLDTRPLATAVVSQIEGAILLMKTYRHDGPIDAGVRTMLSLLGGR